MASSDCQIDKPQHGRPKKAELPDVNTNTGAQSINTGRASIDDTFDARIDRLLSGCDFVLHAELKIGTKLGINRSVCSSTTIVLLFIQSER